MLTTQTVPQVKDTAIAGDLYMSFELGDKKWKLTASDGHRGPSRYNVDAGDTAAVAHCIGKALEHCKLEPQAGVHSCYEAGRDGWWLHRWLVEQGGFASMCRATPPGFCSGRYFPISSRPIRMSTSKSPSRTAWDGRS